LAHGLAERAGTCALNLATGGLRLGATACLLPAKPQIRRRRISWIAPCRQHTSSRGGGVDATALLVVQRTDALEIGKTCFLHPRRVSVLIAWKTSSARNPRLMTSYGSRLTARARPQADRRAHALAALLVVDRQLAVEAARQPPQPAI